MADSGKILVTGAGGFIGSHLVEALLKEGHSVRAFVRYNSNARRGWLEDFGSAQPGRLETFFGDITDARAVDEATAGCVAVYHLAALIGIPYSFVAPASYVSVNVNGTLNVLEAARRHAVGRLLVTSTSEVYGTALFTPITEDHALQAQSPYAATKIGADQLALSYHRAFGLPVTVVRPFNTYGPRQSMRAVIPTIVSQALFGDAIHIGSRDPVRDMVFVEDTVQGFLALAASDECVGKVTNLATGIAVAVGELIDRIQALVGRRLPVIESAERKRPEASEVFKLLGSAQRAKETANWAPKFSLLDGLTRTVAWFRQHADAVRSQQSEYRV